MNKKTKAERAKIVELMDDLKAFGKHLEVETTDIMVKHEIAMCLDLSDALREYIRLYDKW